MVKRLSTELAQQQAALDESGTEAAVRKLCASVLVQRSRCRCDPTRLECPPSPPSLARMHAQLILDDGTPLPVWLKDRKYLNPLLAAYDDKIAALEGEAAARSAAMAKLQEQARTLPLLSPLPLLPTPLVVALQQNRDP